jgi:hypothetical protein
MLEPRSVSCGPLVLILFSQNRLSKGRNHPWDLLRTIGAKLGEKTRMSRQSDLQSEFADGLPERHPSCMCV